MLSWTKNNSFNSSNKTAISKRKISSSLHYNKYQNSKIYLNENHPTITQIHLNKTTKKIKNNFHQFNPFKKINKNVSSKTQI